MKHPITHPSPSLKRPIKKIQNFIAASTLLVCLPWAGYSHAQSDLPNLQELMPSPSAPIMRRSLNGTVQLFGRTLVHPMPVWSSFSNGAAPAEQSKFQRSNRPGIFRLDVTPQDDDFKDWKNLFSIIAFDKQNGPIDRPAAGAVQHFQSQCSPNNLEIFPGNKTAIRTFLVVACGNYSRKREIGEVALVVILKQENLAVSLMRQWRGKSFISKIKSQWPVQKAEIDAVLREMMHSRILPPKQP